MISYLLLLGLFGSDEMQPGAGALTAPDERIVVIPRVQSKGLVVAGAPLGVSKFAQPYDPADHGEYAIGFGAVMDVNERIIDIQYIGVSASGAGLGIGIDTTADHIPRITDDGKHVQYWPLVDERQWSAQDFNAAGVNVIVKARVLTNRGRRWERSADHEVRQL